uniref:Uncharacterized protein n=1 Tax=Corvus moneduloides TaxID=1196302 RepID=A0A8C3E3Z6_CORMO
VGDSLGCFLVGGLMCFWILVKCIRFMKYLSPLTELATDQKVKVMQADFAKNSVYKNIEKDLKDLDIGVLGQSLRQKGLILNLSSGLSHFPCPLYTMYSATKVNLSHLQAEYKVKVITIQVVIPYGTSAPMTMYQNSGVITKTAGEFVTKSLEYVTFGDEIFGYLEGNRFAENREINIFL